jgi:hypothetical protein
MNSLGDCFRLIKEYEDVGFIRVELVYWALAHCHGGPWAWEYVAMCRLELVYHPADSAERMAVSHPGYHVLCDALLEN